MTERLTLDELLDRHRGILLDAYGVLVDASGPLPGAAALTRRLEDEGRPWFLVTNDASRHPENIAARHAAHGLTLPVERVLSSGALLTDWFRGEGLDGAATLVLGPSDVHRLVREAGGAPFAWDAIDAPEVVVVADEDGYPFLEAVDHVLSLLLRRADQGALPRLVLPNPDRVYPKADGAFGLAAGSIALLLEDALRRRHPGAPGFVHLGKPEAPLFDEARARAGTDDLVMLGDQLETDVAGARAAGLAAALVETGVGRLRREGVQPDYVLADLR